MTKELFYVEITKSGWVLAEDKFYARRFAEQIEECEFIPVVRVSDFSTDLLIQSECSLDCLVHHDIMDEDEGIIGRLKDITLGQALDELDKNPK